MRLKPDTVLAVLRARNTSLQELANHPEVFDRACRTVYKSIPLPLRWFVGKKRVRRVVSAARDLYLKERGPAPEGLPGAALDAAD
jgi:hypothetical protein